MGKRKREDEEEDEEEEERAVFVDTNLDTHLVVLVSPLLTFSHLKEHLVLEHSKCFPDLGMIKIAALKIKRGEHFYHLPGGMLLRTAFHGVEAFEGWSVFADIARDSVNTPPETQTICVPPSKSFESNVIGTELKMGSSQVNEPSKKQKRRKKDSEEASAPEAGKIHESGKIFGDCDPAGHAHNDSSVSADAAVETDIPNGTPEVPGQLEGTGTNSGKALNQESSVPDAAVVSGSGAKRTKKIKKGSGAGVDRSHAEKIGQEPDINRDCDVAVDNEKTISEREPHRIETAEEGTTLKVTDDLELNLSQREPPYLVDRAEGKEEQVAPLKPGKTSRKRKTDQAKSPLTDEQELYSRSETNGLESAETRQKGTGIASGGAVNEVSEVENSEAISISRARKTKTTNKKDVDGVIGTHAEQLDVGQIGVAALDNEMITSEKETDINRTAEAEIMESGYTAKKRKKRTTKTSVTAKQDLPSPMHNNDRELADSRLTVAEMLQASDFNRPEQDAEIKNSPRMRSPSKQTSYTEDSAGFALKEPSNEKTSEMAAPETVTDECLRDNRTNDAQLSHEELNGTPSCIVVANVAEGTKGDKPQASKKKAKKSKKTEKLSQDVAELKSDTPEAVSVVQADDHSTVSGDVYRRELGESRPEQLNEVSVQKVSGKADMGKTKTSKSKRKKLDQPSSVDTSSNLISSKKDESERTSLDHQHYSGVHKASPIRLTAVESFQLPQEPEVDDKIQTHKLENNSNSPKEQQLDTKTVEHTNEAMLNTNVNDAENQEEVLLHAKGHDGLAEVGKLDNEPASRLKAKKLDLSSSVDTSSDGRNLITSKKSKKIEINVRIGNEAPNGVTESELSGQIGAQTLERHQASKRVEPTDIQRVKSKTKKHKKQSCSANGLSEAEQVHTVLTNGNSNDPKENPSGLAEVMKPEKPRPSKQKVKGAGLPSSVDIASKVENLNVSNKKSGSQNNATEGSQLQKLVTDNQDDRKSHARAKQSITSKELIDTRVPVGGIGNSLAGALRQMDDGNGVSEISSVSSRKSSKSHLGKDSKSQSKTVHGSGFRTPSNKHVGKPLNTLPQKKRLPATSGFSLGDLSSDSSDGEIERNDSSSSTRTPSEGFSSSDYSEGESKGEVMTSQHDSKGCRHARYKMNFDSSQDLPIDSIFRSSTRYKKAKLVASQSQMEDGESQVPEYVPDSLA